MKQYSMMERKKEKLVKRNLYTTLTEAYNTKKRKNIVRSRNDCLQQMELKWIRNEENNSVQQNSSLISGVY